MVDIERLLGKFGLTPKEIQAYLAMIKLGPATAGQIASRAGLKRPTVYIILEELRQKELLLKIPHTKKAIYQAKSPQELYNQMAEQVGELHEALPQLRSIMGENKRIRTLYFEGLKEIEEALHYKIGDLRETEILGFFAKAPDKTQEAISKFLVASEKWTRYIRKHNITPKGITPADKTTRRLKKENAREYNDIHLVPEEKYSSSVSVEISDLFVRIIDLQTEQAVIIENENVVKAFKDIYKLAQKNI